MRNRQNCFVPRRCVANRHARALLCKAPCLLLVAELLERSSQTLRRLLSLPKVCMSKLSLEQKCTLAEHSKCGKSFLAAHQACARLGVTARFSRSILFPITTNWKRRLFRPFQQIFNEPESCRDHVATPGSGTHPSKIPEIWMCLERLCRKRGRSNRLRGKMQLRATVQYVRVRDSCNDYGTWNLSWPAVSHIWRVTMRSSTRTSLVKKSAPIVASKSM